MSDYGTLESRVRRKSLLNKVMKPEDTIKFFENGQNLVWSGFTPAGYPKAVPIALAMVALLGLSSTHHQPMKTA